MQIQIVGPTASAAPSFFPKKLVVPSPIVSVQPNATALLDTVAQVTLLYWDFYDKHLKHLNLQKKVMVWAGEKQRPV